MPENHNGWERTIRHQRAELELLLETVPSLKSRWETSFGTAWRIALKMTKQEYPNTTLPEVWPHGRSPEEMLDQDI